MSVTCYEPDGVTVCRFNGTCHEARRMVAALTAPPFGPMRGADCWAYVALQDRLMPHHPTEDAA